jgi:hypothetical protein
MILSVLTGLLFGSDGYYVALAWTSSALMYFIVSLGLPLPPSQLGQSWGQAAFPGPASALLSSRCALCGQQPWALMAWGAQPLDSVSSST